MQDRFKVRAWDKEKKEYFNPLDPTVNGLVLAVRGIKGDFDMYGQDLQSDKFIMEQCTGLKDKNGKLIYEGDIVQVDSRVYYVEALTLVVRFHNGAFMAGDRFIDNNSNFMKVIGNIHENPELLEEQ